ncbi:MAG: helix-turn-helix transcriptional regulator [Patulibacter sp.]
MKLTSAQEVRDMRPHLRAEIEAEADEVRAELELHAVRERRGVTQQALAERLSVSRPRVSAIERADKLNLATIQRYVEALGGHLKVTAVFDDGDEIALR